MLIGRSGERLDAGQEDERALDRPVVVVRDRRREDAFAKPPRDDLGRVLEPSLAPRHTTRVPRPETAELQEACTTLSIDELIDVARQRLTRDFTEQECRQCLGAGCES